MHEGEQLGHAPKPAQIRRPAEDDQPPATAQEDGQAPQVRLDVPLVDAALVEPDPRLAAVRVGEERAPALHGRPLAGRVVVPRVGHESVAVVQACGHGPRKELGVGVIPGDVGRLQPPHVDAPEALRGLGEGGLGRAAAEQTGDARSRALSAAGHQPGVQARLHGAPEAGAEARVQGQDLRGQEAQLRWRRKDAILEVVRTILHDDEQHHNGL
mmetsp:Transcript_23069/g.69349  ORF Transcript_23069/g.69349 Transcript_23069/m.69349 type:complete len:213 (+) Transcript_23069:505-1143(+)